MRNVFIVLGILCIGYYGLMYWSTRKWNSTFALFWIVLGISNIILGISINHWAKWIQYIFLTMLVLAGIIFVAVEILIGSAMLSRAPKKLDYIIILGAQVRGTRITDSLKRRLDKGIDYLYENPETMVIVSGGQGTGEDITEAQAMSEYLMDCGIEEPRILLEDESRNTRQNLKYSLKLMSKRHRKTGIVTNNFHIYRSIKLARTLGFEKVYGIPAGCKPVLFVNYMVREFFAVIQFYIFNRS